MHLQGEMALLSAIQYTSQIGYIMLLHKRNRGFACAAIAILSCFNFAQPLSEVGNYGENIGAVAFDGTKGIFNEGTRLRVMEYPLFGTPTMQGSVDVGTIPVALQVVGNRAYSLEETGKFHILDISNGNNPFVAGALDWVDWKNALWVRRTEDYAYIAGCQGVRIIDIRNKSNPQQVTILPGQCTYAVTGDGGYLYVARSVYSSVAALLDIYSLANPAAPVLIGSGPSIQPAVDHQFNGLAVFGDTAYTVGQDETIVLDISDRTQPRLKGTIPGRGGSSALDTANGILHTVNFDRTSFHSLASPVAPAHQQTIYGTYGDQSTDVAAVEGVSLSARSYALWVTGLSEGSVGFTRALTPGVGRAEAMARNGDILFVGTGQGIAAINISNPSIPSLISHRNSRWSTKLAVNGSYLYNLSSWGFLEVYNISNPASIVALPTAYPLPNAGYHSYRLVVEGNLAVVTAGNKAILYDVAGNGQLTQRSTINLPNFINAADFSGSALYIASMDGNLRAYDISNRANPTLAATRSAFNTPLNGAYAVSCKAVENRVHVTFGRKGYALFDVFSSLNPTLLDTFPLFEQEAVCLDVVGSRVYSASGGWFGKNGIHVFDTTNPSNVTLISTADTTNFAADIVVYNGFAYCAETKGGLRVRTAVSGTSGVQDWSLF